MEKKYELLCDRYIEVNGTRLYQIRAVRDFGDTISGDLGGYIQSEGNLSHEGLSWVHRGCQVYGTAKVAEDACVTGHSIVCDNAQVLGRAKVQGRSQISGNAIVHEDA